MSEKKVTNIKEINFDNSKINRGFSDNFINSSDIENILINNIPQVQSAWFRFQSEWSYNAYQSMKDLDKYLILVYLIQKTLIHYSDLMVIISEETMYAQDTFEIDKINLIEISEELGIPKETIRRKINELSIEGIVERSGKRIILKVNAFQKQRPVKTVKTLASFLAICSNLISSESNLLTTVSKESIEAFIRTNFTLIWRFYFKTQIPTMIDWRKYYGDLETWVVTGVVLINQSLKLRDLFKGKGITLDLNTMTNDDKFKRVYEFIFSNSDKIVGVNASSIAEITGIPRATVIRKLKYASKFGLLVRDKNQLYVIKKLSPAKMKEFAKIASTIQRRTYKFIGTFFELYKNKAQLPQAK